MKRGSTKIAELPVQLRAQVVSLRRCGHDVLTICDRLHIDKASERNAVSAICAEPALRRYGHDFSVSGPVKAGPNRAAVIRP